MAKIDNSAKLDDLYLLVNAEAKPYLTLEEFDSMLTTCGLMDDDLDSANAMLIRFRRRNQLNAYMDRELKVRKRLMSVNTNRDLKLGEGPGTNWAFILTDPHESFALQAARDGQRMMNHLGRSHKILADLTSNAREVQAVTGDASLVAQMMVVTALFDAARASLQAQLASVRDPLSQLAIGSPLAISED